VNLMATHYKGQRITELLEEIAYIKQTLDDNNVAHTTDDMALIADWYTKLALTKAKLTALMGDNYDQKGKKS
jgi:hypothetical protein